MKIMLYSLEVVKRKNKRVYIPLVLRYSILRCFDREGIYTCKEDLLMGNAKIIVTMGGMAIGSHIIEKLCTALGKQDIAQSISVVTISLIGTTVATASFKLLSTVNSFLK